MQMVEEFGRTLEEATEKAVRSLGATSEGDLEIQVIDPGRKATSSGFGAKFARIKATLKEGVMPARAAEPERARVVEEEQPERPPQRPERRPRERVREPERQREEEPVAEEEPAREEEAPAREAREGARGRGRRGRGRGREAVIEREPEAAVEEDEEETPVFRSVGRTGGEAAEAEKVLKDILRLMGVEADVEQDYDRENSIRFNVIGEDLGALIGKYGQTIEAVQYLVNLIASRQNEDFEKVSIDIEGYRDRRERSLEELATRMARKVRQDGKSVTLEPMLPSERRIIHMALSDDPGVRTYSQGEEPMRKVIISPARRGGR